MRRLTFIYGFIYALALSIFICLEAHASLYVTPSGTSYFFFGGGVESLDYNGDIFAGINSGKIVTSCDFENWDILHDLPEVDYLIYINGSFVAFDRSGGNTIVSQDGLVWESAKNNLPIIIRDFYRNSRSLIAFGFFGGDYEKGYTYRSTDGLNWQIIENIPDGAPVYLINDMFVIESSGYMRGVYMSEDGKVFTRYDIPGVNLSFTGDKYFSIEYGNVSNTRWSSSDLKNWEPETYALDYGGILYIDVTGSVQMEIGDATHFFTKNGDDLVFDGVEWVKSDLDISYFTKEHLSERPFVQYNATPYGLLAWNNDSKSYFLKDYKEWIVYDHGRFTGPSFTTVDGVYYAICFNNRDNAVIYESSDGLDWTASDADVVTFIENNSVLSAEGNCELAASNGELTLENEIDDTYLGGRWSTASVTPVATITNRDDNVKTVAYISQNANFISIQGGDGFFLMNFIQMPDYSTGGGGLFKYITVDGITLYDSRDLLFGNNTVNSWQELCITNGENLLFYQNDYYNGGVIYAYDMETVKSLLPAPPPCVMFDGEYLSFSKPVFTEDGFIYVPIQPLLKRAGITYYTTTSVVELNATIFLRIPMNEAYCAYGLEMRFNTESDTLYVTRAESAVTSEKTTEFEAPAQYIPPVQLVTAPEPREVYPNYVDTKINAIAYNGERYVAGGSKGLFISSVDLVNWTPIKGWDDTRVTIYKIEWDGERFISYTLSGAFTSVDGLEWRNADELLFTQQEIGYRNLTVISGWGAPNFAYDNNSSYRSYDQINWHKADYRSEWPFELQGDFVNPEYYFFFNGLHYVYSREPASDDESFDRYYVNISADFVTWEKHPVVLPGSSYSIYGDGGCVSKHPKYAISSPVYRDIMLFSNGKTITAVYLSDKKPEGYEYGSYMLEYMAVSISADGINFTDTGNRLSRNDGADERALYFSVINEAGDEVFALITERNLTYSVNNGEFQTVPMNDDRWEHMEEMNKFPTILTSDFWNGIEYMTFLDLANRPLYRSKDNADWEEVPISEAVKEQLAVKGLRLDNFNLVAGGEYYMLYNNPRYIPYSNPSLLLSQLPGGRCFLVDRNFNLLKDWNLDGDIYQIDYEDNTFIITIRTEAEFYLYLTPELNFAPRAKAPRKMTEYYNYVIHGLVCEIQKGAILLTDSNNKQVCLECAISGHSYYRADASPWDEHNALNVYAVGDKLFVRGEYYFYIYSIRDIFDALAGN